MNPSVAPPVVATRQFSFTFAGPRALDDIIKKELLENKTGAEIADIWYTYHEARVSMRTFGVNCVLLLFTYKFLYVLLYAGKCTWIGLQRKRWGKYP